MSCASGMRAALRCLLPAMLLLLASCFSGLNSNQAAQQTYVLRLDAASEAGSAMDAQTAANVPAAAAAPANAAGNNLQVLLPVAGAGLSGEGVAVLRPGQRLDYYSGARWAAPAPVLLQALVVQRLRGSGRFTLVESDTGPFEASYLLSLELSHFEANYADSGPPTVRVTLVCALGQRSGRRVLDSFTVQAQVPAASDRMQAVVAAFEQATNQALAQLANRIRMPAAGGASAAVGGR